MPDYHPLDVRYKGPSTAYRGSAKNKPTRAVEPNWAKTNNAATPKVPTSPWGPQQRDDISAEQIVQTAIAQTKGQARNPLGSLTNVVGGVFRTLRYAYFTMIAFFILISILIGFL